MKQHLEEKIQVTEEKIFEYRESYLENGKQIKKYILNIFLSGVILIIFFIKPSIWLAAGIIFFFLGGIVTKIIVILAFLFLISTCILFIKSLYRTIKLYHKQKQLSEVIN